MPSFLNPHDYLRVTGDQFTPVRDQLGKLLGCVPRVPDNAERLANPRGSSFELRIAAQVCVCIDTTTQTPTDIPNFIPLDSNLPSLAHAVGGDDPDLAEGV